MRRAAVRIVIYIVASVLLIVLSGVSWHRGRQLEDAGHELRALRMHLWTVCKSLEITDRYAAEDTDRDAAADMPEADAIIIEMMTRARRNAIAPALGECNVDGPVRAPPM